eukprot:Plantae.Rhodophyta-Hildenbrandia_rubra.ctg10445.p1 GENE.Plantae.Rhodophyta-Hildenbrandia_rubra.ctg10445~~Plantae.Rhodophyta-Hildenbrandia_rubra.ctg10445.p1  ORF type:complete len:687 (-),score=122.67 Plantae.Rhodophyta-Hildenbrandia_rubra.ctg10445:3728-5683(-)
MDAFSSLSTTTTKTVPHLPRSLAINATEPNSLLPKVHLDLGEIKVLRCLFKEHASEDGLVDCNNGFPSLIQALLGEKLDAPEETFLYRCFDTGHDGRLNAREFVMGCSVLVHGCQKDRVRFLFHVYEQDGFVPKENLKEFAVVSQELEKYYGMPHVGDCNCEKERIGIKLFSKILTKNEAVVKCMQVLHEKVLAGIRRLEKQMERQVIANELADMGFGETKYWEDGYDVFAAASNSNLNSTDSDAKDSQSPSTSKDSLNLNGLMPAGSGSSQSLAGRSPRKDNDEQRFEICFEKLGFERRIGEGSFAEVWKGRWLDVPVAIKIFEKSKRDRPCDMRMCGSIICPEDDEADADDSMDFGESLLPMADPTAGSMCKSLKPHSIKMSISQMLASRIAGANMDSRAREAQSFNSEVQLLTQLRHPNVQLYLGACTDPQYPFCIVSEIIEGGSLFDYLHKCLNGPPDVIKAMNVAQDVARGMFYLHSNNPPVLHRDLKAANILLENCNPTLDSEESTNTLKAVIIDFGLSRAECPAAKQYDIADSGMIGSLVTMAPEVMRGERYTSAADVYSYGIVLWELFTGRIPFTGLTQAQLIYSVSDKKERPTFLPEDSIPPGMKELMKTCWEDDAKNRPDFHTIIGKLREIKKSLPDGSDG